MQATGNKRVLIQMRDLRIGNGIAACIMNYYEYTVQNGFEIDFLLNRNIDSPYVEVVRKNGSHIFVLPHDTGKPNKDNIEFIRKIVTDRYDIFHVNISGFNALEALKNAKKAGIVIRIYHAHNPKETSSIKARIRSALYETPCVWIANKYAACSSYAGNSLFGKKSYTILKNAVDISRFVYDENARNKLRTEMGIDNKFVVGVVGRLAEQKNPYFIIDVFKELKTILPEAVLIWAGDGELRKGIIKYVNARGLDSDVQLLGSRTDVNQLYSVMDAFLLPSKFEGFGIVFIEAQISGLECYGSDRVPSDVEISGRMHRLSLKISAKEWANEIFKRSQNSRKVDSWETLVTGYESSSVKDNLVKLYSGK